MSGFNLYPGFTSPINIDSELYKSISELAVAKGDASGENVYMILGTTNAGRYLSVFFIWKHNNSVLPISAWDMDNKERRRYRYE